MRDGDAWVDGVVMLRLGDRPLATRAPWRRRRSQDGQTVVEFAIVLPLLLTVVFAIIEFGTTISDKVQVTGAARDAARVASVSRRAADREQRTIDAAVESAGALDDSDLEVDVQSTWVQGDLVTVTVRYPYSIDLYGTPVDNGMLESTTSMRVE
jgi:Flp pilus assembly protein TadG